MGGNVLIDSAACRLVIHALGDNLNFVYQTLFQWEAPHNWISWPFDQVFSICICVKNDKKNYPFINFICSWNFTPTQNIFLTFVCINFITNCYIMSHIQKYMINVHHKGNVIAFDEMGLIFENTEICHFTISRRSSFQHLKERIKMKLWEGSTSQITYRNSIHFGNNQFNIVLLKVHDDEDVEMMFMNHEFSGFL